MMRTLQAKASPWYQKRAQTDLWWATVSSVEKDPIHLAAAGLERYAMEGRSTTSPRITKNLHADALSPKELNAAFRSAKEHLKAAKAKSWLGQTTGPVSMTLKWLSVAKWKVVSPTHFEDSQGNPYSLLHTPPRQVAQAFVKDYLNQ